MSSYAEQSLTAAQTSNAVRQHKGKTRQHRASKKLSFRSKTGHRLVIQLRRDANYAEVEEFVAEVLEEITHRRNNNVHL